MKQYMYAYSERYKIKERDVRLLQGLANGHSRRVVAAALGLDTSSLNSRIINLYRSFTTDNLEDLLKKAYEDGLITEPIKRRTCPLSPRMRSVLQAIANGCTTKEIAAFFSLSIRTVYTHMDRIRFVLKVNSIHKAVIIAFKNSWIS